MKKCNYCQVEKSETCFSPDIRNPDKLRSRCKECCNKIRRDRYYNDIEYKNKVKSLQKKYLDKSILRAKRHSETLSDTYVIAELKRGTNLTTKDIRQFPQLIELKRILLKQNRENGNKKY